MAGRKETGRRARTELRAILLFTSFCVAKSILLYTSTTKTSAKTAKREAAVVFVLFLLCGVAFERVLGIFMGWSGDTGRFGASRGVLDRRAGSHRSEFTPRCAHLARLGDSSQGRGGAFGGGVLECTLEKL